MPLPSTKQKKISYRLKVDSKCPVCKAVHQKEELMSGSGRLNAGNLTLELRRLYIPTKKWGVVLPEVYAITVCPNCLFASFPKDFKDLVEDEVKGLQSTTLHRKTLVRTVFGDIDFNKDRDLPLGAASYMLAVDCYHLRVADVAPTPKKAVAALRAAWLLDELAKEIDYRPYDKARDFYYIEASKNYRLMMELMQSADGEPVESAAYMLGPSPLDKNWGFDGVFYLSAFLTRKYIDQIADTDEKKLKILTITKRYLSKLYGSGKASKAKPAEIIDKAKDLYDEMGEIIEKLEEKLGKSS